MVKIFNLGTIDTVHGVCPHCNEQTILVAIVTEFYRCTICGEDTKQHVNGSIQYLKPSDVDIEWLRDRTSE